MDKIDFTQYMNPNLSKEEAIRLSTKAKVDTYNATAGKDDGTGYNCKRCLNRGNFAVVDEKPGHYVIVDCACKKIRETIRQLQREGVWEMANRCKLQDFKAETPTQQYMKETVEQFIADPEKHWLLLCGQSGAGKTHLCTAAYTKLAYQRKMKGYYFQWNADSRKLRTAPFEDRDAMYEACKTPDLLYIDDLFKGSSDPNDKEVQLVFEILNYRYNNRLTTILSSEMTVAQLLKIDQATVSRILQLCDPYIVNIEPDTDKNYRLHGLGKKVL